MTDAKASGMKSALELAMERLEQKDGKIAPLSTAQKQALAEVDSRAKAKTAETEILMQQRLAAARASGAPAQIEEVEGQLRTDLNRIRRRAEDDKERIRRGAV